MLILQNKMEISDCMWDEDFLCVDTLGDLEEPSHLGQPPPAALSPGLAAAAAVAATPFQWSLADEADNSDMTPQCMPVIDPKFVRDHFIEDCVIGRFGRKGKLFKKKASEQIGAWKCNFPPFFLKIMTDRPTNRPHESRGHREVTLPPRGNG